MGMLIPAAIGGAAQLGGAVLGGKAQKHQADAQAKSTASALDFAKQQEATKLANYTQAMDLYKQQWQARQARIDQLLGNYGFSMPADSGAPPMSGGAGMPTGTPNAAPAAMPQTPAGVSAGVPLAALTAAKGRGDGDVFGWNRYGLA